MLAEQSLKTGNLDEALNGLSAQVRKDPSDAKLRIFLFQLLAVRGEWDRAMTQLKVSGDLEASALAMVQTYREAIGCELVRKDVFAGKTTPLVFGEPEQWMAYLFAALKASGEEKFGEARELRAKAFDEAPTTTGTLDNEPFEWIADADARMGPMLEIIMNGKYQWMPFARVKQIKIEKPEDLRDLVWAPAYLTLSTGAETVGFIPTRYPGSEAENDSAIQMAKKTEWIEKDPDTYFGLGQRLLATDKGEYPLLDVREIKLEVSGGAEANG